MSLMQERTKDNAEGCYRISSKQLIRLLRDGEGYAVDEKYVNHVYLELKDE